MCGGDVMGEGGEANHGDVGAGGKAGGGGCGRLKIGAEGSLWIGVMKCRTGSVNVLITQDWSDDHYIITIRTMECYSYLHSLLLYVSCPSFTIPLFLFYKFASSGQQKTLTTQEVR